MPRGDVACEKGNAVLAQRFAHVGAVSIPRWGLSRVGDGKTMVAQCGAAGNREIYQDVTDTASFDGCTEGQCEPTDLILNIGQAAAVFCVKAQHATNVFIRLERAILWSVNPHLGHVEQQL